VGGCALLLPLHAVPYTPASRLAKGKSDPGFRTKPQLAVELVAAAQQAKIPFWAVVADCFYGDNIGFVEALGRAGVAFVLALKPRKGIWAPDDAAHTPVEAARELGWGGPARPGPWRRVTRRFRDGHAETWWAADAVLGGWGPDRHHRLVVATTDPATLPKGCCDSGWAGRSSGPSGRPRNATRTRSSTGSSTSGRGSKGGPRKIGLACLLRRIGHLADPTGAAHLVTARYHPDPASPHGVEEGLDGGRARLLAGRHQGAVVLSPATRQLRHRRPDRGAGAAGRLLRQPTGGAAVGRTELPLELQDTCPPGQAVCLAPGRAAAGLRPGTQPRRIPVGQPQVGVGLQRVGGDHHPGQV
jgi:hypothetical protein